MLLAQGYCLGSGLGKNGQGVAETITQSPHVKVDTDDRSGLGCTLSKLQCKLTPPRHPEEELLERQLSRLTLGAHIVATTSSTPKQTREIIEN
ncbi:hypothetical protein AMTR_s00062p00083060 [Amborella trichopoda]|uniref:G-patch domain-containing protein n=1 Tax=Amborella trichopoda TaxID=13333 RepID=U5DGL2_AMBTC|nr:hypothetical protein AMTR_s00062p00083060 [Amborella trichopoda]